MGNKKNIALLALIGIMVVIALVVFLRPKRRQGCAAGTPQATAAPVVSHAPDAKVPAHKEVKALNDWFVENNTAELVATCPDRGVFGLDGKLNQARSFARGAKPFPGPPSRGPLAALAGFIAGKPRSTGLHAEAPPPTVPMALDQSELQSRPGLSAEAVTADAAAGADPQLSGVICTGGVRVALFGAESCKAGDTVPNTSYRIVEIGVNAVTLRSEEGQELRLDLLN